MYMLISLYKRENIANVIQAKCNQHNDNSLNESQSSKNTFYPCKIAREISLGLAIFLFCKKPYD